MDKKSFAEPLDIRVQVQISPDFAGLLSPQKLRTVAETSLRHERVAGQATLVITDDQGIQALNRDFLGIDAPTDVLAFATQEPSDGFVTAPLEDHYLGDVIISYPRALDQAQDLGHSVEHELCLLIIHGVLHLLGYDHTDEEQKAIMWGRQAILLTRCLESRPPGPVSDI
jgi:probable rRNA maturation factor